MKVVNINKAEVFTNKRGMQARMVLNEDSFQVVNLFLEAGKEVPSHVTPVDVFFLIRSGQGTVVIGSEEQSVSQDSVIFSPANIPHALRADLDSELDVLIVKAPNPSNR